MIQILYKMSGEGRTMDNYGAGDVSAMYQCQSSNANKLVIYDLHHKLKSFESKPRRYDIGGVYSETQPEVWFYFTTVMGPGHNYLLNLFLMYRRPGDLSIGISASNEITFLEEKEESDEKRATLSDSLVWFTYKSIHSDEQHYIKTFCFSERDVRNLENRTFFIPIKIEINAPNIYNKDILETIKVNHDLTVLFNDRVTGDFELISNTQKKFKVHKIILSAHSPVLKELIMKSKSNSEFIDVSDNELMSLLEFIYTGAVKNILKQDIIRLLEIASTYKLNNLIEIADYAICETVTTENAFNLAIISEKHKLERLQTIVFDFIANNMEVNTKTFKNFDDKILNTKLTKFLHAKHKKE